MFHCVDGLTLTVQVLIAWSVANEVGRGNRVLSVSKPRDVFFLYLAFQSPLFRQLAVPLASNSGYSVRLLLARRLDLVSAGLGFLHDTLRLVPESLGHRLVTALHFFVADIDLGVSRSGGTARPEKTDCAARRQPGFGTAKAVIAPRAVTVHASTPVASSQESAARA